MIAAARTWFLGLSLRERWLVATAGALAMFLLLIFAFLLPLLAAIDGAAADLDEAVARRGRIEAMVASATGADASKRQPSVTDVNIMVTQGAAEKGFDLIISGTPAPGQATFRIDQARAPALLTWLNELEAQGVQTGSLTLRGGPGGSVTVQAELQGQSQ